MKVKILFDENGNSTSVINDASLFDMVEDTEPAQRLVRVKKKIKVKEPVDPKDLSKGLVSVDREVEEFDIEEYQKLVLVKRYKDDPDIYDVEPAKRYVKKNGKVRPMTKEEAFESLSPTAKRVVEYHNMNTVMGSILHAFTNKPELRELIKGTMLEEEIKHFEAVNAKYPV